MTFPALTATETELGLIPISADALHSYIAAVDDQSSLSTKGLVPATALAAWCLARLIERMGLPAGTLHGTQEIESLRTVHVGETLACTAKLGGRSQRAGWEFTTADFALRDAAGATVLRGRSMVMQRTAA